MRRPAAAVKPRTSKIASFPAPTGGWVSNRNLAQPKIPGAPQGAAVLENFFPTATSAVLRRGSVLYATLGDGSKPVAALFSYNAGSQQELFGATDDAIYDLTTITTASNWSIATDAGDIIETDTGDTFGEDSTIGKETLTSLTGGNWSVVQFATGGGIFLRGVNGMDAPFVYDGTTWGTAPALTFAVGETTTANDLSYVWAYKTRLFFIQKESLDAYYLPVDSIGGELVKLPLGGVFERGGSLLFGATWSNDSGNQGGLSEQCIFVTTEGEVAVFQGTDPSVAASWSKVGVYRIGKPLGPNAFIRAGGDLVIATSIGFVPLSQAVQRDYAALSPSAVSYPIETAWNEAVTVRGDGWNCEVWPDAQMVVVAPPTGIDDDPVMFVANARTGAWAPFTNWLGTCLEVFKGRLFFGSVDGKVIEANVGGLDQGKPYTGSYVPLFEDLRSPASMKIAELARVVIRSTVTLKEQVTAQFDYDMNLPSPPSAAPVPVGNEWGNAIWGESVWGGRSDAVLSQNWHSVSGSGYTVATGVQITSGAVVPSDAEIIRTEMTYINGDILS